MITAGHGSDQWTHTLVARLDRVREVPAVDLRAQRREEPLQPVRDGQGLLRRRFLSGPRRRRRFSCVFRSRFGRHGSAEMDVQARVEDGRSCAGLVISAAGGPHDGTILELSTALVNPNQR